MTEEAIHSPVPVSEAHQMTLGGLHVVRSICNPIEGDTTDVETSFSLWCGAMEPEDEPARPLVMGQVFCTNALSSHMLGVTIAAICIPGAANPVDPHDDEQADEFLNEWGNWASHVIWDYAVGHLRSLASGLMQNELDVPIITPTPSLLMSQTVRGHDESSAEDDSE